MRQQTIPVQQIHRSGSKTILTYEEHVDDGVAPKATERKVSLLLHRNHPSSLFEPISTAVGLHLAESKRNQIHTLQDQTMAEPFPIFGRSSTDCEVQVLSSSIRLSVSSQQNGKSARQPKSKKRHLVICSMREFSDRPDADAIVRERGIDWTRMSQILPPKVTVVRCPIKLKVGIPQVQHMLLIIGDDFSNVGVSALRILNAQIASMKLIDTRLEDLCKRLCQVLDKAGGTLPLGELHKGYAHRFKTELIPSLYGAKQLKNVIDLFGDRISLHLNDSSELCATLVRNQMRELHQQVVMKDISVEEAMNGILYPITKGLLERGIVEAESTAQLSPASVASGSRSGSFNDGEGCESTNAEDQCTEEDATPRSDRATSQDSKSTSEDEHEPKDKEVPPQDGSVKATDLLSKPSTKDPVGGATELVVEQQSSITSSPRSSTAELWTEDEVQSREQNVGNVLTQQEIDQATVDIEFLQLVKTIQLRGLMQEYLDLVAQCWEQHHSREESKLIAFLDRQGRDVLTLKTSKEPEANSAPVC